MTVIFKYLTSVLLIVSFIGCQNDSPEQTGQQQNAPQQNPSQQQPGAMGNMQQPAPDVELTDEEAELFADVAMQAQQIQMEGQQDMMGIIEDEGLDMETYKKIAQATQMGQTPEESGASEADIEKFNSATDSINQAQAEIQSEINVVIEESDMDLQRFQQINQAVQQDPELQKQIRAKIQEQMQGSTGGMQSPQPQGN